MSFPRYEKYKDSGVEWLGAVPEHWEILTLGRITQEKCDGPFGSGLTSEHYTESGARVIRLQNIRAARFFEGEPAYLDIDYFKNDLWRHNVMPGDLLIAGLGDENNLVGRACVAPDDISPALVKADCFRFRIDKEEAESEFIALQLCVSAVYDSNSLSTGSTRSRIPLGVMASRKVVLPPLGEQRKIAEFIRREAFKIDALIAEQRTLIDLLKEKRQAVISHAVTKGLNPQAPMKDSGVEWLGAVPEHWNVAAVSYRYEILLGKMLDEKRITGKHLAPYLRNVDVQWDRINIENLPQMDFSGDDIQRYSLKSGDLLVCEGGEVGRAAIWRGEIVECYYQKALHRLRQIDCESGDPRFMFYLLRMAAMLGIFEASGGKSTIAHLTAEALRRYRFGFPPKHEQNEISKFLDSETVRLDALIAEAEATISLLQERRAALISAAVTGKIDVRGLVAAAVPADVQNEAAALA